MLLFIDFRLIDAIDILLVALLIFNLYKLIKGSVALNIITGILAFYFLWVLVRTMNMQLLESILGQFIGVGFIALIVVFQPEIRRFLLMIGSTGFFSKNRFFRKIFRSGTSMEKTQEMEINSIVKACRNMSESKTGAIIVMATQSDIQFYANTGALIDSRISSRLIETIFYKNSPLHDGAILITGNRILAARCVLPVTDNAEFPVHLGMRHRAAVGVTENSDAIAIAVSEQTGAISFSKAGNLTYELTPDGLYELLMKEFA